jgi:hypothetical protein
MTSAPLENLLDMQILRLYPNLLNLKLYSGAQKSVLEEALQVIFMHTNV